MNPTPRQQQVIDMIASGMTHRECAEKLGITRQSVKDHLHQAKVRQTRQPAKRNMAASLQAEANRKAIYAALQVRALAYGELLAEFPDMTPKQIEKACERLSNEGCVKSYASGRDRVWAATQALADKAFESSTRAKAKAQAMADAAAARQRLAEDEAVKERQRIRAQLKAKAAASKAGPMVVLRPMMDSVSIKAASGAEAIVPKGLVIQSLPTPPSRYAPEPGFARAITGDWALRRQGVEIESRFSGVY